MSMEKFTLLDDDDDMVAGRLFLLCGDSRFCLQASGPAALDSFFSKSCSTAVLARLGTRWFSGVITRKSQEQTQHVYDYRVQLEQDQSKRIMKLLLRAYSTEINKRGGGCVDLLEPDEEEQTEGTAVEGGGHIAASLEISKQAYIGIPAVI